VEITISDQVNHLFLSCGLGFLLGLYYDFYRVPRLIMRSGRRVIFFQDVLFFLTSSIITFLFSLAVMDGKLRFYLFLGEAIGFAAYYFTIGRLVMKFTGTITALIISIWKMFWQIVLAPFRFFIAIFKKPIKKLLELFIKTGNIVVSSSKKVLKQMRFVLYNREKVSEISTGTKPRVLHKKGKKKK